MPTSKKPRKKYRPKHILADPVGYVTELMGGVKDHETYLRDLKLRNSAAMTNLLQGRANKKDMDVLIAMSNITEALYRLGHGKAYQDVAVAGRAAILGITWRAVERHRYVPTGPEINALNMLMELHDAQMEVICVQDMDRAIALAEKAIHDKDAIQLPRTPDNLKAFIGAV